MPDKSRRNKPTPAHSVKLGLAKVNQELDILTYDRYWRFGLDLKGPRYTFASNLGSILVDIAEFKEASKCYPIVFMTDDLYLPHAVMGLLSHLNLAINAQGLWQAGLYQPNRIKLYPFGIIEFDDFEPSSLTPGTLIPQRTDIVAPTKKLLAIDASSSLLVSRQENPEATALFNTDGTATPAVQQAAELVQEIEQNETQTRAFVAAMKTNDVLVEKPLKIHFHNGTKLMLTGINTISWRAVKGLSQSTLERWERMGYLSLIKQHWKSHDQWAPMITLYEKRMLRDIRFLQGKSQVPPTR